VIFFWDHTIVHFEIPANDIEKLKKFYVDLFGWTMNKYPGPTTYYLVGTVPVDEKTMMPTRQGVNGGLYERMDAASPELAIPINYVSVEFVDEYSKKVVALSGKIVVPKMEIPGLGWWALALDPEGNHFGMLEYMHK
jgi:hypothetical protein